MARNVFLLFYPQMQQSSPENKLDGTDGADNQTAEAQEYLAAAGLSGLQKGNENIEKSIEYSRAELDSIAVNLKIESNILEKLKTAKGMVLNNNMLRINICFHVIDKVSIIYLVTKKS